MNARLNEFDKEEWRSVMRRARPEITEAEYDEAWAEFAEMKRRKEMQ